MAFSVSQLSKNKDKSVKAAAKEVLLWCMAYSGLCDSE
jgi:hypothetical protein